MKTWLKNHAQGSLLLLYIQPGASRSEVAGIHAERLKVKIKAPPREGEANRALIEFVAKCLGISKSRVFLIRGESPRQKDLVAELLPSEVLISLGPQAG